MPAVPWRRDFPQLKWLLDQWLLERDGLPLREHRSLVLPVSRLGRRLMLKIVHDRTEFEQELDALVAFADVGAIEVLEDSRPQHAMLLARAAGTDLASLWSPDRDSAHTRVLVRAADRLSTAIVPVTRRIPSLDQHLSVLRRLDLPLPADVEQIRSLAADLQDRLTATTERVSLLHADLHHENLLTDGLTAIVIDPLAAIGDPLYDTAPMLHNPCDQLADLTDSDLATMTERRVALIAELLDADPGRVAGWGLVRAAASVVWSYEDGDTYATLNVPLRCAQILAALI